MERIKLEEDWKGSNWKRRGKNQLEKGLERVRNDEDRKENELGEDWKGSTRD